jgi:molecular chaperone DnaJ
MPVRGGAPGDLLCRVLVETPVNLTKEQRELLERFGETLDAGGEKHNPQASSWLDGVKRFFDDLKF